MNVRDHRDRGLAGDRRESIGVLLTGTGHADDVAARRRELGDLLERRVDVVGLGRGHGLDRDRVIAAHAHLTHKELTGLPARRQCG